MTAGRRREVRTEAAARTPLGGRAGRCDWDALQTAITAAVKPDIQSPKKSPNAKRLPGLEDA